MIKAIIFDLDGTLVDTIGDIGYAINEMLKLHGFPLHDRAGHLRHVNYGARELVRRSLPEEARQDEELISRCLAEYEELYGQRYMCDTVLYPGISAALAALKEAGYPLSVLSNKQENYVKDIVATLLPSHTFFRVGGQGEFPCKPDPAYALRIAEELGLRPDEVAFIGDSHVDMQTARRAGMHPVGVCWGYRDRETLLENGAELLCDTAAELVRVPAALEAL